MIYLLENNIKRWIVKAYTSYRRAKDFSKWLNARYDSGSVYTVWTVREVQLRADKTVSNVTPAMRAKAANLIEQGLLLDEYHNLCIKVTIRGAKLSQQELEEFNSL
jgi:hypothetical protein